MENKNDDSFLSISSEEEEEEEENPSENNNNNKTHPKLKKEKENYHNLFNFNSLHKNNINNEKSNDNDKEYILRLREKLNKNTKKIKDRKLLILPAPENNLSDYHQKIEEDDNKGYVKLMNPDNLNVKKEEDIDINNDNSNKDKNIISINQKDILDSNWEIKYINNILKKDMKDANKKDKDENEENKNGKKRKRDKNDIDDEFGEERVRSKYSKITTKRKYGW